MTCHCVLHHSMPQLNQRPTHGPWGNNPTDTLEKSMAQWKHKGRTNSLKSCGDFILSFPILSFQSECPYGLLQIEIIRLFSVDQSSNPCGGSHFPCSHLVPTVSITKFLLKSKTQSSWIQWKRGWKNWCCSSAAYLVTGSWNYNCPETKFMWIQKISRTKPWHRQAASIYQ